MNHIEDDILQKIIITLHLLLYALGILECQNLRQIINNTCILIRGTRAATTKCNTFYYKKKPLLYEFNTYIYMCYMTV